MKGNKRKYIDITVPLKNGLIHWPNDPPYSIKKYLDMNCKDPVNISLISMCSHSGTHIDSPLHFIRNGKGLDGISFDKLIGPCRVIEIKDGNSINIEDIKDLKIEAGDKILFKTENSRRNWQNKKFNKKFVYLSNGAADYLAEKKVSLLGIDYLSVGQFDNGDYAHKKLLKAGICILEGLDLKKVKPGNYELICLPIKIKHGDGAPVRAILRYF